MLLNRRHFLVSSTVFVAGCAAPHGVLRPGGGEGRTVNLGSEQQYLKDGVYTNYSHQGFFVVRRGAALFAVSAICTHRQCVLTAERDRTFYCPCHGSTFNADGKVTTGPARRDLPVYELSTDEKGNLLIKTPPA